MVNATPDDKLSATLAMIRSFVPEFSWVWKSDCWYHKAIGWVFNKLGMAGYNNFFYTTLRYTVGRPNDAKNNGVSEEWQYFCHEGQHSVDAKNLAFPLFALIYGFPQILAGLAVPLAILLVLTTHSWVGLLGLLVLLFASPLPAIGRVWAELRGYRVSLSVIYWYSGIPEYLEQTCLDAYQSYFTGPSYYFMGFFYKNYVQKKLRYYLDQLKSGRGYQGDPYLTAVRELALSFLQ